MKHTILQNRTGGALYNQEHAVCFNRSTNPLCPLPGCRQLGSALHMLSGCHNHIISSIKTECYNVADVAGRMIIKPLSKSPRGAGFVSRDLGGDDRLAQHSFQISANVSESYPLTSFHVIFLRYLDSPRAVLMLH
eukprot:1136142-Pelagomonas_calceolata.AAC.1